ncbi:hypothetical protein [Streptomyces sp. NPDC058751]|uniref:hypothetical protein n=1 Tax=Streptomyces sp. NPDC058751 TaxID=3346623 RepID=UPI00367A24A6
MTDKQSPDFTTATPSEDHSMHFEIHPDDLKVIDGNNRHCLGLAILREAAEHFSSPFEPADVTDEEIEQKVTAIFGEEFTDSSEELEESDEENNPRRDSRDQHWYTSIEFSLQLPLQIRPVGEEATEFWFFPYRGDQEASRRKRYDSGRFLPWTKRPRPKPTRKGRLAAELDVRSTHWREALQMPSDAAQRGESHVFVLTLPSLIGPDWQACKRCPPEPPSNSGELLFSFPDPPSSSGELLFSFSDHTSSSVELLRSAETLLVLVDSVQLRSAATSPWKRSRAAVGEYRWRSLGRGRRWLDEMAEQHGQQREALGGEVGAVLWLADPQVPAGSPGAAALVPVPERLQPARDHWPQLAELWESTLRHLIAREIHDCCRQ